MKSSLALLCAVLLVTAGACSRSRADDKSFDDRVHAYLIAHPEVILEMQAAYEQKQRVSEATGVESRIPALRKQIFNDARDPSVGPSNAKVTVVEFFDYRCPHCKEVAPDVLALIRSHPDVRFVFKEFPIFGAPSQAAATTAIAAYQEGKYLPVYAALMAAHQVDKESIDKIMKANGLMPEKTLALAEDAKIHAQVEDVTKLATALGVDGTPGFLVNDHYVAGADVAGLTRAIAQAEKAAGAG
jgi:protein-disulfide isomerase